VAADHDALDLVRAFVDLGDLGVSHHSLDGVVVDVPVAAEHRDGRDVTFIVLSDANSLAIEVHMRRSAGAGSRSASVHAL
jgi:hypothetical protein